MFQMIIKCRLYNRTQIKKLLKMKEKREDIKYWLKFHSDCISLFENEQNVLFFT